MNNKVFNNLETFYTDTSYDAHTGILTVSNESNTNTFSVQVVDQVDYIDLPNKPEVIVNSGEPSFVLSEDSVYIDTDTYRVWLGTSGNNLKIRDAEDIPLILDKFIDLSNDYTGKIVRAKDGNLYTQTVATPTIEPTDISLIAVPTLDTSNVMFGDVTFESIVVANIYCIDKTVLGIIDVNANITYSYDKEADALSIVNAADSRVTVNGSVIVTNNNLLSIEGTTYSFPLTDTAVVKPYYDSLVILDDTRLLVLEPAGDIISVVDTEYLLAPIIDDIDISKFMYIDGLLCFISVNDDKYYVIDVIERTITDITTSFEIAGKSSVLLDNGYVYFIQDSVHINGFYLLDVQWKKMGIDDILPSRFCNSLRLTDVMTIENNVLVHIPNANGADLVRAAASNNGNIYIVEENTPTVVSKVAGIKTMQTTTKVTSDSLVLEIVGVAVVSNEVLVATVDNHITKLVGSSLTIDSSFDMVNKVDGDIIAISSLGSELYVLTDANILYVFDNLDNNAIATYALPIVGGLSKVCIFNSSSFAVTDIDGTSTGVYEVRISKSGEVQLSTRIVIERNTYPNIFMYLGKLAVMNSVINSDTSLYSVSTELRRI